MSDNWIAVIPRRLEDSVHAEALQRLADELGKLAPDAEEVEVILGDSIRLFDCGANLESIKCPHCGEELGSDWWQERMDGAYDEASDSFELQPLDLPCCGRRSTLNELVYDFDQGFSRWGVDLMNPQLGELDEEAVSRLESIAGCKLKVIYQHL
jgi:hypothetical protein